jgi:ribosome biogenesis GTPase
LIVLKGADVSSLEQLGWDPFFQAQVAPDDSRFRIARVTEEQRGQYRIAGEFDGWAEVSGRFRHDAKSSAAFPVVGDWVCIFAESADSTAIIHRVLDRRGSVARKSAGRAMDEQVIAANVDTIFLVTALAEDLSPRRIERYLTMVWEAGATPVVLLNKADLAEDPASAVAKMRARLSLDDVVALSALTDEGLTALEPYLAPAKTIALLGSSGVGKSTIVNRLLGRDLQKVKSIRESDGTGRHTTTSRQLIALPGGALLIDTPGMRELQPWADESAVDRVFDDISQIAGGCRFADCSHNQEPGCAVREAIAGGRLDAARLDHYRHLLRELAFEERKRDKGAAAQEKRRWKQLTQMARARYRERERE